MTYANTKHMPYIWQQAMIGERFSDDFRQAMCDCTYSAEEMYCYCCI